MKLGSHFFNIYIDFNIYIIICLIPSVFNNPLTTLAAFLACCLCHSLSRASSIWLPTKGHLLGTLLSPHWMAYILYHSNQNSRRSTKKSSQIYKEEWRSMYNYDVDFLKSLLDVEMWSIDPPLKNSLPSFWEGSYYSASSSQLLQGQPHLLGTVLPKVISFQGFQDGDWGQVDSKRLAISAWCRTLCRFIVFVPKCFTGLPVAL